MVLQETGFRMEYRATSGFIYTLLSIFRRKVGMRIWFAAVVLTCVASAAFAQQPANSMSFFVTSVGPGKGGNLGGLLGADRQCQMLATAAGAGSKTWHAYMSENGSAGHPTINARDRIGNGPWYNAKGVLIASNVAELHSDKNNL